MAPVHASGHAQPPAGAECPIGSALSGAFARGWRELRALAIGPSRPGQACVAGAPHRTRHDGEIPVRLLGAVGFVPCRTAAERTWLGPERAPNRSARQAPPQTRIHLPPLRSPLDLR